MSTRVGKPDFSQINGNRSAGLPTDCTWGPPGPQRHGRNSNSGSPSNCEKCRPRSNRSWRAPYATIRASVHELDSLRRIVAGKMSSGAAHGERLSENSSADRTRGSGLTRGGMDNQLRPLNLGEILDRTAQLYRRNFWLFVGTAALPLLFVFALAIPAGAIFVIPGIADHGAWGNTPATIVDHRSSIVSSSCRFTLPCTCTPTPAITQATVSVHLGEKPTIRATLKSVRPRFWTYLWYLVLQGIMAALVPTGRRHRHHRAAHLSHVPSRR